MIIVDAGRMRKVILELAQFNNKTVRPLQYAAPEWRRDTAIVCHLFRLRHLIELLTIRQMRLETCGASEREHLEKSVVWEK